MKMQIRALVPEIFTGLSNPVGISVSFRGFLLGCQTQSESRFHFVGFYWVAYGKPVEVCVDFRFFFF